MATYSADLASVNRLPKGTWLPALFGVLVICIESTQPFGATQTSHLLGHVMAHTSAGADGGLVGEVNHLLRKTGHFTGYGMLGLLFARAWHAILQRRGSRAWDALRIQASWLAIGCTFLVACGDELHQRFTPGRGPSFHDVMLDTAGALSLNLIALCFLSIQRSRLVADSSDNRFSLSRLSSGRMGNLSRAGITNSSRAIQDLVYERGIRQRTSKPRMMRKATLSATPLRPVRSMHRTSGFAQ